MAVQQKVTSSGAVTIGPSNAGCSPFPSVESVVSLNETRTYGVSRVMSRSLASPAAFVDMLAGLGISAVRLMVLRVQSGSLQVRVSSSAGVDQVFNVSSTLYLSNPLTGTELTAVSFQGTADFELVVAGDE